MTLFTSFIDHTIQIYARKKAMENQGREGFLLFVHALLYQTTNTRNINVLAVLIQSRINNDFPEQSGFVSM